jgi:predicted kinase
MKNALILVRGCPGAGKNTFARLVANGAPVIAADDFFMRKGFYDFDKRFLGTAHKWCQNEVERYLKFSLAKIFVANTFTTRSEMQPYIDMAKKHGYDVYTIIVENRHGSTSIHNVPEVAIDAMKNRFDIEL